MNTIPQSEGQSATASISRIEASLRCFVFSLLGLVPFLGIPFSVSAMLRSRKLQQSPSTDFNPADRYLKAASRIAPLGFLSTAVALLFCVILPAIANDFGHSSSGGG